MRLDKYLVEYHIFSTRSKAQDQIQSGNVMVNKQIIYKNSFEVLEGDCVEIQEEKEHFVSRAGYKLFDVLDLFQINLNHRHVIDVGASTGGFSDVCLQQNADIVYALDVGHNQLDPSLFKYKNLINMEGVNCRYLQKSMFSTSIDFACIDVSFISLTQILPAVFQCMDTKEVVALVKPQFEVGKYGVNKHGIVKDTKAIVQVLQQMKEFIESCGMYVHHACASSIYGRDGNKEFVFHIKEEFCLKKFDFLSMVIQYNTKR